MRVEWTSYSSPIGVLTVVECEAGPLQPSLPDIRFIRMADARDFTEPLGITAAQETRDRKLAQIPCIGHAEVEGRILL